MKVRFLAIATFGVGVLHAQSFQDLSLQTPNSAAIALLGASGEFIRVADALPGWTVSAGGVAQSDILYNSITESGSLAVFATRSPDPSAGVVYEFRMATAFTTDNQPPPAVTLSQTAFIPTSTKSLDFIALISASPGDGPVTVAIDGTVVPYSLLKPLSPRFSLYEADISGWAGQTAQLSVSVSPGPAPAYSSAVDLGGFAFSSTPVVSVPEPGTYALALLAFATLGLTHWRLRR